MFRLQSITLCCLLLLSAPAGAVQARQLAYGPEAAQILDLYRPDTAPSAALPAVVLAHGGLWQSGGRDELSALCGNIVSRSGEAFACASIDYRLSQELGGTCDSTGKATYLDQVGDLARAFAFLQSNAEEYGIDPQRLFVGGHSAGAHLAQLFNLRTAEFEQPCAPLEACVAPLGAIGIEGIYDIPAWNEYDAQFWNGNFRCATRKAFGAPGPEPAACFETRLEERCWDAGSPAFLARNSEQLGVAAASDVLLVHAPGDDWVDSNEAIRFAAALQVIGHGRKVIAVTDGSCGVGGHNEILGETALADCIIEFMRERLAPSRSGNKP